MNSEEEQGSFLIGDAMRKMMAHGLPRQIADLSIRASIRDIVSSGNLLPGGLLVFVPGDKGVTPALNYEIQAVYLKIFYGGQVTNEWVSIRIPRSVIDAATPPWRPLADNDDLRRLANGTTGRPLPTSASCARGAQEKLTIRDKATKWFMGNATRYRLDERCERTRMYGDAARDLNINDGTAKAYLSQLVNGKTDFRK